MSNPPNTHYQLGQSIPSGSRTITPVVKTWIRRVPGGRAGLVWNRPSSVIVQHADGREEIIPVPDVTRRLIWAILGASLGAVLIIWIMTRFTKKIT